MLQYQLRAINHYRTTYCMCSLCMWLAEGSVSSAVLRKVMMCVCVWEREGVRGTQLSLVVKSSPVSASLELTLVWISRRWCHSLNSGPDACTKPSSVSTETCQTSKQSAVQLCMRVGVWGYTLAPASKLSRQSHTGLAELILRNWLQIYLIFSKMLWETTV